MPSTIKQVLINNNTYDIEDTNAVYLTGNQSIAGQKVFTDQLIIPTEEPDNPVLGSMWIELPPPGPQLLDGFLMKSYGHELSTKTITFERV